MKTVLAYTAVKVKARTQLWTNSFLRRRLLAALTHHQFQREPSLSNNNKMNELIITLPFSLIKSIESFVNFVAKTYLKNQCPLYEVKPMLKVIQIRNLETTTQNIREEINASVLEAINLEFKIQLVNNVSTTNVVLLLRPTCFQCSEIIRHLSIKLNKKLPDSFKLPRHITEEKHFSFSFLDLTLVVDEEEWV